MPQDLVKVLKTQDAGYIRTQRAMEESVSLRHPPCLLRPSAEPCIHLCSAFDDLNSN